MSKLVSTILVTLAFMTPITVEANQNTSHSSHVHNIKTEKKKKPKKRHSDTIFVKNTHSIQTGKASWYGKSFLGKKTASGERLTNNMLTAAHKDLPLGSIVKIINTENNQSVIVKINDRGPYVGRRILDLSPAAAKRIGLLESGVATVSMVVISKPPQTY